MASSLLHCDCRRAALTGLIAVGLGGCASGERQASNPDRRPPMPTIAPAGTAIQPLFASDVERAAAVVQLVQSNQIGSAVSRLEKFPTYAERSRIVTRVMAELAQRDPGAGGRLLVALPANAVPVGVVEDFAQAWVARDATAALAWAAGLPDDPTGRTARRAVAQQLVARDPRAAVDTISKLPQNPARDDTLVAAGAAWSRRDPDAAIGWLRELPDGDLRRRLTSSIAFEIAQVRPQRAAEVADMLPAGRDRWVLFSAIAQTWVAMDSKAALNWAAQLPAGEARDAALAGADTGMGIPGKRRIADAPGTRSGASRTRGGGAAVLVQEVNSAAFAAWLATQPPGMSRDEAILEYVRQRGALEPGAIGPWLESLPQGATRDRAMQIYVEGLVTRSPLEATRWVQQLPRSDRSDELLEKTARELIRTNPDAAAQWIEQSTLPQDRKDWLLREAGR